MWYKEKYRIVTENPYNKEKLNGLGLVIYSEWKDSFVNIIQQNGRTRQTLWRAVQMLTQKLCCQTIHDCPKVVPLHYESE